MSTTTNYSLELPQKGQKDWNTHLNGNFTKIDTEIHKNASNIGDITQLSESDLVEAIKNDRASLADMTTNVKNFGAKGDGITDDTTAIQNAINFIKNSSYISELYFPPGEYVITSPLLIDFALNVKGIFCTRDNEKGTMILDRTDINSATPFITYQFGTNTNALDNRIWGVTIKDIKIVGNTGKHDAIHMVKTGWDMHLENVYITDFLGSGIYCDAVFDGTFKGVTLVHCGGYDANNVLKYALTIDSDTDDCTNALHFFGCHFEGCRYFLKLGKARHNQFVACKFEARDTQINTDTTNPYFLLTGDNWETTFDSCMFPIQTIEDWLSVNPTISVDDLPFVFKQVGSVADYNNITRFTGCDFTCGMSVGYKLIDGGEGNFIFDSCFFNYITGKTESIKLKNSQFVNNKVKMKLDADGNAKGLVFNYCIVKNNRILITNPDIISTTEYCFSGDYTIYEGNDITGFKTFYNFATPNNNQVTRLSTFPVNLTDDVIKSLYNISSIDFSNFIIDMRKFNTSVIRLKLSADVTISQIIGGCPGEEVTILNNNGTSVTIKYDNSYYSGNTDLFGKYIMLNNNNNNVTQRVLLGNDYIKIKNFSWLWRELVTAKSQDRNIFFMSAIPTSGYYTKGDIVFNNNPIVGSPKGWVCTVSGTPGTFVSMGNL